MQTAENVLPAMYKLGKSGKPLTRIFRQLYNENVYLAAYNKLLSNKGLMTKGTEDKGIDGFNSQHITAIVNQMRYERYQFKPARRKDIPKPNGGIRPLGVQGFNDKLVQEVIRGLMEAYYEPQFSDNSHGFRPGRGCHTALQQIREQYKGVNWFIEGDIKGCFDNINHAKLLEILGRQVHDKRFLELIRRGLEAGIMMEWKYIPTRSGTPQGSVLSPLLANIYLNELDKFVEESLLPIYNRGKRRQENPDYTNLRTKERKARRHRNVEKAKHYAKLKRQIPSVMLDDPNYRRLVYVRYADDFLLGFSGPKTEAMEIKELLKRFLADTLHLELSDRKTLITHARHEQARFLGHSICVMQSDTKQSQYKTSKRRSVNGAIRLDIPREKIEGTISKLPHSRKGKVKHRAELVNSSDYEIVSQYRLEYLGLLNYYQYTHNLGRLNSVKYYMEMSMMKTLAHKHKTSVSKLYQKHRTQTISNGKTYTTLQFPYQTKEGTKYLIWGGWSLKRKKKITTLGQDEIPQWKWSNRSDIQTRLEKGQCEVCHSDKDIAVHHIRKLKDLKKRWQGRKDRPLWVKRQIALNRKTLVVCRKCHTDIHQGTGRLKPS